MKNHITGLVRNMNAWNYSDEDFDLYEDWKEAFADSLRNFFNDQ
jgi:hypothetical protein